MLMIWRETVDAVHCGNCSAVHGENEIAECSHCLKDACSSCGDVRNDEQMPYGYHTACAAYVDDESDIDSLMH